MGYMFRYSPGFGQVADWARDGLLGDSSPCARTCRRRSIWPSGTEQSRHHGGILYDLGGAHDRPDRVAARAPDARQHRPAQRRDPAVARLLGQYRGRFRV